MSEQFKAINLFSGIIEFHPIAKEGGDNGYGEFTIFGFKEGAESVITSANVYYLETGEIAWLTKEVVALYESLNDAFWVKLAEYDPDADSRMDGWSPLKETLEELLILGLGNIGRYDVLSQTAMRNFDSRMEIDGLPIHLVDGIYASIEEFFTGDDNE